MSETTAQELLNLGIDRYHAGALEDSVQWLEAAIAKFQEEGNIEGELLARSNLCEAYTRAGYYVKAIESATILLAKSRQANMQEYQVRAIGRLGMALQQIDLRGRWKELRPLLIEGVEMARNLGLTYWEVQNLETLGSSAVRMGEHEQGLIWLQDALAALRPDIYEEAFFRTRIYQALSDLARSRGDWAEAVRYAEIAVDTAQTNRNNSPHLVAAAKLTLAQAERLRGERATSLELVHEVLPQARREKWRVQEQSAEYLRSELERELGHPDVAEEAARRALELAREMRMKEEEVMCLLSWGQALLLLGRKDEARDTIQQARWLSQERDYEDHFYVSEELLAGIAPLRSSRC